MKSFVKRHPGGLIAAGVLFVGLIVLVFGYLYGGSHHVDLDAPDDAARKMCQAVKSAYQDPGSTSQGGAEGVTRWDMGYSLAVSYAYGSETPQVEQLAQRASDIQRASDRDEKSPEVLDSESSSLVIDMNSYCNHYGLGF